MTGSSSAGLIPSTHIQALRCRSPEAPNFTSQHAQRLLRLLRPIIPTHQTTSVKMVQQIASAITLAVAALNAASSMALPMGYVYILPSTGFSTDLR